MKTNSDLKASAQRYYLWGTLLTWFGVLIWAPFIILQIVGQHPSFLWFLPFHLVGVVGGSRLRAFARKEMGIAPPKRNLLRIAGSILIALGILAWAPYFYLKVFTQTSVEVMNFLPFHLIGVLGGVLLLTVNYLISRKDLEKKQDDRGRATTSLAMYSNNLFGWKCKNMGKAINFRQEKTPDFLSLCLPGLICDGRRCFFVLD